MSLIPGIFLKGKKSGTQGRVKECHAAHFVSFRRSCCSGKAGRHDQLKIPVRELVLEAVFDGTDGHFECGRILCIDGIIGQRRNPHLKTHVKIAGLVVTKRTVGICLVAAGEFRDDILPEGHRHLILCIESQIGICGTRGGNSGRFSPTARKKREQKKKQGDPAHLFFLPFFVLKQEDGSKI